MEHGELDPPAIGSCVDPVAPVIFGERPGELFGLGIRPGHPERHPFGIVDASKSAFDQSGKVIVAHGTQLEARRAKPQPEQRPDVLDLHLDHASQDRRLFGLSSPEDYETCACTARPDVFAFVFAFDPILGPTVVAVCAGRRWVAIARWGRSMLVLGRVVRRGSS
ncbi:hypothetical protein GCM10027414_35680 [Humibacter ginsengiterrae]